MEILAQFKYTQLKQIGVGQGMNSEVFLADDPQLGGRVAVKEIPHANFKGKIDEYFREAQTMFKADHPNVVPIRVAGECPGRDRVCLSMPYFARGSLQDRIAISPLRLTEMLRIGQGILSGLGQIHRAGFIHFDLKPSNVLMSDRDDPMVADFGQTRPFDATGVTSLPPMYPGALPPEFFITGIGTIKTDIYHAGLTLYRAVNGDKFFKAQEPPPDKIRERIIKGKFPDRNAFMPHVPQSICRAIRKALSVDATKRFASANEFADTLARINIRLDWNASAQPNGEITWTASRPGQATIEVTLRSVAAGWDVEAFTVNSASRRAKQQDTIKATSLSYDDAMLHFRR